MYRTKSWFQSKGVWGSIGSIAAGVGMFYGVDPDVSKEVVKIAGESGTDLISLAKVQMSAGVAAIISGSVSLWGRLGAKDKIG